MYRAMSNLTLVLGLLAGCTQETQNKFGRAIQNWTGTNGVLEIYAGEKLVKRFIRNRQDFHGERHSRKRLTPLSIRLWRLG